MKCSGNEVAVVLHSFTAQETKFAVMTFIIGEFVFFFSLGISVLIAEGVFEVGKKELEPRGFLSCDSYR